MIVLGLRRAFLAFGITCLAAQIAQAQIVSIERGGSSGNTEPMIAPAGLAEDSLCFVDRTHEYNELPGALVGIQYVMVANDDKSVADYSLEITLEADSILYLIIDDRVGDDDNTNGPTLGGGVMDWVLQMGFSDSGLNVGIDESGDGDIDQTSSVYWTSFPAGGVVVLEQDDGGGRNMYGIAAQIRGPAPVPVFSNVGLAIFVILLLGGGVLAIRRVRMARLVRI